MAVMGTGSSPPARGLRSDIPTWLGDFKAHPRLRGDYHHCWSRHNCGTGSSPPARGLQTKPDVLCQIRRLIPACAGTTAYDALAKTAAGAHPRLRGDYHTDRNFFVINIGSSPPARGLRNSTTKDMTISGLIPACAGTTFLHFHNETAPQAHPRLRGDYVLLSPFLITRTGSSPPARGLRNFRVVINGVVGLIPACAGTTHREQSDDIGAWAHPRLRGDYMLACYCHACMVGSSPPARGLHKLRKIVM